MIMNDFVNVRMHNKRESESERKRANRKRISTKIKYINVNKLIKSKY